MAGEGTKKRIEIGDTGVAVPALCFGTTALSDMPVTYGYSVDEERALATVRAILESDYPFLDTSRNYGLGRSEERVGKAIRDLGGLPPGAVVSTKLDRDMETLRLDAGRARRSIEESLVALGLDQVHILHLHDPEYASSIDDVAGPGGALEELFKMKEEGLARAVGLAAGRVDVMMPLLERFDFDCLVTHNRFTLVNTNAEAMIDFARSRGIHVFNAAPYASGVLAKGSADYRRYAYQVASDEMLEPVRRVEEICARHGVPPGAAALQFSLRDPRITSTMCGVSRPERVAQTLEWAAWPIPPGAWDELDALPKSTDDPESTRTYDPG